MDDTFEKRVRGAASAAWWTVLVVAVFVTFQWILYLIVTTSRPAWVLRLWGPDVTWPFVQTIWFSATAVLKLFVWILAVAALWLTLWAKQLRKGMR